MRSLVKKTCAQEEHLGEMLNTNMFIITQMFLFAMVLDSYCMQCKVVFLCTNVSARKSYLVSLYGIYLQPCHYIYRLIQQVSESAEGEQ